MKASWFFSDICSHASALWAEERGQFWELSITEEAAPGENEGNEICLETVDFLLLFKVKDWIVTEWGGQPHKNSAASTEGCAGMQHHHSGGWQRPESRIFYMPTNLYFPLFLSLFLPPPQLRREPKHKSSYKCNFFQDSLFLNQPIGNMLAVWGLVYSLHRCQV